MSRDVPSPELLAFAEARGAFLTLGSDEERGRTDRYSVTFTPGAHFWVRGPSVQHLIDRPAP